MVRLLPRLLPHAALSEADIGYSRQDALFRAGHRVKWRHFGQVVSVLPLDEQFYRDDHLFVHLRHEVVMLDGEAITLTRMEYRLLTLLLERAGEVVPRAIIVTELWGGSAQGAHTLGGSTHGWASEKTRGIRRPVHRNGPQGRIQVPATARALGFKELREPWCADAKCDGTRSFPRLAEPQPGRRGRNRNQGSEHQRAAGVRRGVH